MHHLFLTHSENPLASLPQEWRRNEGNRCGHEPAGVGQAHRQTGMTLIELMIAIALGIFVAFVAVTMIVNSNKANVDTLNTVRLNQELRAAMSLMTRDLRRSGYSAEATKHLYTEDEDFPNVGTPPLYSYTNDGLPTGTPYFNLVDNHNVDGNASTYDCVVFAYDVDKDGVDDGNSERMGYRLDTAEDRVEQRKDSKLCNETGWEGITDENTIAIDDLSFMYVGGTADCIDVDAGPTTSSLTIKGIRIRLRGHLANDVTVSRTLEEVVRVRNDENRSEACP